VDAALVANGLSGLEDVFDVAHDLLEQLLGATVGHFPVGVVARPRGASSRPPISPRIPHTMV
jgi:hypothetical protein